MHRDENRPFECKELKLTRQRESGRLPGWRCGMLRHHPWRSRNLQGLPFWFNERFDYHTSRAVCASMLSNRVVTTTIMTKAKMITSFFYSHRIISKSRINEYTRAVFTCVQHSFLQAKLTRLKNRATNASQKKRASFLSLSSVTQVLRQISTISSGSGIQIEYQLTLDIEGLLYFSENLL